MPITEFLATIWSKCGRLGTRSIRAAAAALLLPLAPLAKAEDHSTSSVMADIAAHPALWKVQGVKGTAYLFGSIHALPPNVQWHTPQITSAINQSDVFVFEIRPDALKSVSTGDFMKSHGTLPPGQSLRAMLSPEAQKNFDAEVTDLNLPAEAIDRMQPWLASLVFGMSQITQSRYATSAGVDLKVFADADARGKEIRALETTDQQLSLLALDNQKAALQGLESDLKELRGEDPSVGPLVDAWSSGDENTIDRLMNSSLAQYPGLKQKIMGDRNHAWVKKIEAMLSERRVFFITVGAGHLAGSDGVPDLLRKAGYRVTRL